MERWQIVENFVKTLSDEKERWDLLPWEQLAEVVKIISSADGLKKDIDGKTKHAEFDWQKKKPFFQYFARKMMRHFAEFLGGSLYDKDSGKDPLAHVIFNALCLLWGNKHLRKS